MQWTDAASCRLPGSQRNLSGNPRGAKMNETDRRVKRSRKLLQEAFRQLLTEKGFDAISVQDVAERAEVNRGTFYAHFPDKYALLEQVVGESFREALLN